MIDYDLDELGQLIIKVLIPDAELAKMLEHYFDGECPACNTGQGINHGALICDDCFDKARAYREQHGY